MFGSNSAVFVVVSGAGRQTRRRCDIDEGAKQAVESVDHRKFAGVFGLNTRKSAVSEAPLN